MSWVITVWLWQSHTWRWINKVDLSCGHGWAHCVDLACSVYEVFQEGFYSALSRLKMFEFLTDECVSDHNERIRSIQIDKFFIAQTFRMYNFISRMVRNLTVLLMMKLYIRNVWVRGRRKSSQKLAKQSAFVWGGGGGVGGLNRFPFSQSKL